MSSARVEVSTIGEVTVGSNTRVRLVETRDAHHRLALERGSQRIHRTSRGVGPRT